MNKWISAVVQGALLAVVPVALGQGLCVSEVGDVIHVREPEIGGGKLYVPLQWPLEVSPSLSATIEVLDRTDAVVASRVVVAQPGEEVFYPLTEDAVFFEDHGYWYTFRVVDLAGEFLAPTVSGLVTFCQGWESCVYRIAEGVAGDTISMSTELFGLLDDLETGGSQDLLGDALGTRPNLDFEIYWVADQMAHLQMENAGSECVCQWVADMELNLPRKEIYTASGEAPAEGEEPDWQEKAVIGPGATLHLAGQILGGPKQSLTRLGREQAGIHLRCWSTVARVPFEWAGRDLSMPTLAPCKELCPDARVSVSAWAESVAVANGVATWAHGALGYAKAEAEFFMGDSLDPMFTALAEVEADRPPGSRDDSYRVSTSGRRIGAGVVWRRDVDAGFVALSQVETCLSASGPSEGCLDDFPRPVDDNGSWAYGCARLKISAIFVGEASCALQTRQKFELKSNLSMGSTEDGVLIKPWRP